MTENEKLIKSYADAIDCLKKNKPTSGYYMLQESVDMAIKALEEVQQYRQIGSVELFAETKKLSDLTKKCGTIGVSFDECAEYAAIGTVEEFREAVEKQKKGLSVDEAKRIAAKAICIGCGYLTGYECSYNGRNCMISKPMLESVSKSFDDWNRRANDGKID